ncbi:pentapeptide repeat-containing protein [Leptothoe sp. PORK10 BA2]|uniref:pentapeptide repeat-containing protein n=1 Tax=Leptothoe sp. PORK10 BA2 TaxID=3110254 RepID=UPI002B207C92|nr:pentapeptide repeat-containing protein [Leptothoe sp. PORK10 BA2]
MVQLDKARLRKTSLRGANFTNASLRESKLSDADLTDAVFTNAHLEGTDLSDTVGLTNSQIESAIINPKTRLPAYLQVQTKD